MLALGVNCCSRGNGDADGDLGPYPALLPTDFIITWVVAELQTPSFLFSI